MSLVASPNASRTVWHGLHCFLHWQPEHVDAFITGTVAPLLDGLRDAGATTDWFFIRYSEGGPHLRIRVRDATSSTARELRERLVDAVRSAPYPVRSLTGHGPVRWHRHGEVREIAYEPETERYGGITALSVAEDVFCRSSQIAVAVLARTPAPGQRLVAATDLILATAVALDLDMLGTARWLRRAAIAWRWHRDIGTLAPPTVQGTARDAAAAQSAALLRRWAETEASAGTGSRLRDQWAARVRAARASLEADPATSRERWLEVWSSQLHMLLNRLGVRPDEERSLYWFISASLLAPSGATDFFADHPGAVDRRYLEASNFVLSRIEWQEPRSGSALAEVRRNPFAGPPVALPSGDPVAAPLHVAMANRVSSRGDLGGPVCAADLGRLLRSAYAGTARPGAGAGSPHRPYPSAGASYVARLRLIVRTVDGLAPGQYEVDQDAALSPLGPAPDDDELVTASMWFSPAAPSDNHVDAYQRVTVATLPALLALYVELSALRASYGLRALRFALLEAGHLAQNLALTAAATGLALGMVGGFYDDIAHELFLLDGVDDVLVYLLPVGRPPIG